MTFRKDELLDEGFKDLPDWYAASFKFKNKTTCMDLSFHGEILAVGQLNGLVEVMDSSTSYGRKELYTHDDAVSSVTFSRDGHHLASSAGNFVIVHDLGTKEEVCNFTFDSKVISCIFSRINPEILFILVSPKEPEEEEGELQKEGIKIMNIRTKECEQQIEGPFTTFKLHSSDTLFACYNSDLSIYEPPAFELKDIFDTEVKRGINSIEVTHKGVILAILDKSGCITLFDRVKEEVVKALQDKVTRVHFVTAAFDRHDEHIICGASKMTSYSFTSYDLSQYVMRSFQNGPREAVLQLLFHPLQPIIFARAAKGIHIWKPIYKDRWKHSVPEYNNLLSNEVYDEPESEFDEGHESGKKAPYEHLSTPIDIFTREETHPFDDDVNFPDQMFTLPVTIDDIKDNSSEEEEEDYDSSDDE